MCRNKGCTILGAGFGLYGYLPAAVSCGYCVFIPERYRMVFDAREELHRYKNEVFFVENESEAIEKSVLCIIAKRPEDQYRLIPKILNIASIERIILEKPLASNPAKAWSIYEMLNESNRTVNIGYSFFYTVWGENICRVLKRERKALVHIEWSFMAHHFRHGISNWKRYTKSGGGILRFYGIQIIGVLAIADEWEVLNSVIYCTERDEAVKWNATIICGGSCRVNICIDSRSDKEKFIYQLQGKNETVEYLYEEHSPFIKTMDGQDSRVVILEKIITCETDSRKLIKKSVELWDLIEKKSKFIALN